MTWASQVLENLINLNSKIGAQNVSLIASYNGTTSPNKTIFSDWTAPEGGRLSIQVGTNTSESLFGIYKNSTFSYFNELMNLTSGVMYGWEIRVAKDDVVNFVFNQSIGVSVELFWQTA